jgi:histidinol-phosphate/aromatic aminotransferase/cobyric acid decarboxylase-like protein
MEARITTFRADTQVADDAVTTPHGGQVSSARLRMRHKKSAYAQLKRQEWRQCHNFVEDFSVTTNGMGPPAKAEAAARSAPIDHYPPANFEPHLSDLAEFLWPGKALEGHTCLQLGNGASELIDLVIRSCANVGTWRPGPSMVQYEEYKRSSEAAGFVRTSADDDSADLMCLVNPTNPTGDYMRIEALKSYIKQRCRRGTCVLVDESMQPWVGPNWREDSLVSQSEWRRKMSVDEGINVFVIHSWTKVWSCTGLRLGSVIAPTPALLTSIKARQVPWSVNAMALAFLSEACRDKEYLETMWKVTTGWRRQQVADMALRLLPRPSTPHPHRYTLDPTPYALHSNPWRRRQVEEIASLCPSWRCRGEPFLSWVWIEMPDESTAERAVSVAKLNGTPVRWSRPSPLAPSLRLTQLNSPQLSSQLKIAALTYQS